MKSCCVVGCEPNVEQNVMYFEFPTSRALRRKWLDVIKLTGKLTVNSVVCSQHFGKSDYEEIRGKTRLKRKVVPSLVLGGESIKSSSPKQPENLDAHSNSRENSPSPENSSPSITESIVKEKLVKRKTKNGNFRKHSNEDKTEDANTNTEQEHLSTHENTESSDSSKTEIGKTDCTSKHDIQNTNCQSLSDKATDETPVKVNISETVDKPSNSKVNISEKVDKPGNSEKVDKPGNSEKVDKPSNSEGPANGNSKPTKSRKTRVKHVPERFPRFRDNSDSSDEHTESNDSDTCTFHPPLDPDPKQDIEDIITNYHIKNSKPNKLVSPPPEVVADATEADDEEIEFRPVEEPAPVFIEIPVDQGTNAETTGAGSRDCLMVMESVQVDVDPSLLLAEREAEESGSDDVEEMPVKHDPISLLTSSDEDDVILQEPHIDTVEVSDETDEDDVPLMSLLKRKKKEKSKKGDILNRSSDIAKIMWGLYEYYCIQCKYITTNNADYRRHLKNHETVLHICQICGHTTSSLSLFTRHKKKHKDERRFKCHICDYKARHNMSLVYHMKSHDKDVVKASKKAYICHKCGFDSNDKISALRHVEECSNKKHSCKQCDYQTNRRSDLKRHSMRKHSNYADDED